MFCRCENRFGEEPNTRTCPVCLGHPGALPTINAGAVDKAIEIGLALDCDVASRCQFHRKNYFYPDSPKAYQISQYDEPICAHGHLDVDGARIGITRAHLEEDAAKLVHAGGAGGRIAGAESSVVDFNRCGTPLVEIVTEPDLRSPEQAVAFLGLLKNTLQTIGVSDCDMQPTEKIWRNGSFVPWDEANVHILTHALHYGTGVFEGIRAYDTPRGTAVFRLTDHLERLRRSAALYEMDLGYSVPELAAAIHETVAVNNVASCYVRPIAFRGAGPMGLYPRDNPVEIAVAVWPWGAYLGEEALEHGVSCKVSSFRRIGPNTLPPTAKASGQYINSVLAKLEASRAGDDEAILLNEEGYVADGSGENVFAVRDGVLHTPPTTASCLPGITRDTVMRIAHTLGYDVREVNLVRTDLYFADEAFLCGTAAEVTPIASVDGQQIGGRGPITKAIQDTFFAIVSGRDERFSDLLDYPVRAAV